MSSCTPTLEKLATHDLVEKQIHIWNYETAEHGKKFAKIKTKENRMILLEFSTKTELRFRIQTRVHANLEGNGNLT